MVNIRALKERISSKYPNESISEILKNEPDEITPDELIAKLGTWQSVIDASKVKR